MHLGSDILHFSELLKRIICTEALWQSLKRELKQHMRKIGPLLLPGASVILSKKKVSSNIHSPYWYNTVLLSHEPGKEAGLFTQAHVWPLFPCAPESDSQVPWGSTALWAIHPFLYSQLVAFQLLVWIVRASPSHMGSLCSQPSFLAQPICLQYPPALYNFREETLS